MSDDDVLTNVTTHRCQIATKNSKSKEAAISRNETVTSYSLKLKNFAL